MEPAQSVNVKEGNQQTMEDILEEICQYRYTENDPEYEETVTNPPAPPPCVENWYTRPRKRWDYSRGRGQGNRGQGYRGQGHQDYHHRRGGHDRGSYNNYRGGNRGGGYHRDEPSRNMYAGKREYRGGGGHRYEPYQQGHQQRGRYNQNPNH